MAEGRRGSQGHARHSRGVGGVSGTSLAWLRGGGGFRALFGIKKGGGAQRDTLGMAEGWRGCQGHVGHDRGVEGVSETCWARQRGVGGLRGMLGTAER